MSTSTLETVTLTKAIWNALPTQEKRKHKNGDKLILMKGKSGQPDRWVKVVWNS